MNMGDDKRNCKFTKGMTKPKNLTQRRKGAEAERRKKAEKIFTGFADEQDYCGARTR